MRRFGLDVQKTGINRLRTKGGASPEALYDLTNARVDTAGGLGPRGGTVKEAVSLAGTKGLHGYKGKLQLFASTPVAAPSADYQVNVLRHPTNPTVRTLKKIHYVHPLLGRLYVAAEFDDGSVFHYWITNAPAWQATTVYGYLQQVQPVIANGFVYEVSNAITVQSWAKAETIVLNDERQPTTYSGFKFRAVVVAGAAPVRTSDVEPTWPTTDGSQVVEYSYGGAPSNTTPPTQPPTFPPDIGDEYGPFPPGENPDSMPPIQQL